MTDILREVAFPKQRATVPLNIVLRKMDGHHPYATHAKDRDTGATFHGHYFKDLEEAEKDFRKRCIDMAEQCASQGLEVPYAELQKQNIFRCDIRGAQYA